MNLSINDMPRKIGPANVLTIPDIASMRISSILTCSMIFPTSLTFWWV